MAAAMKAMPMAAESIQEMWEQAESFQKRFNRNLRWLRLD
jgi:hypothetical protein